MSCHQTGARLSDALHAIREDVGLLPQLLDEALDGAGRRKRGECPLCHNRTAFQFKSNKARFRCYHCDASGDAIAFVQSLHAVDFLAAVEMLAQRKGLTWTHDDAGPPRQAWRSQRGRLSLRQSSEDASRKNRSSLDVLDTAACDWAALGEAIHPSAPIEHLVASLPLSPLALTWFTARGLDPETAWNAGVRSIDDWGGLALLLTQSDTGFDIWDSYIAGFAPPGIYRTSPGRARRLRRWLTPTYARTGVPALLMPYRDIDGTIVGVRFRALIDYQPKCISQRHVTFYRDGRDTGTLTMPLTAPFGGETLGRAQGRLVHITEGEPDALALRQLGSIAVARPGANSIPEGRWLAALRLARAVCIWPDRDDAGERGANRLSQRLSAKGISNVLRMDWPSATGKDPNDLLIAGVLSDIVGALEGQL